MGRGGPHRHRRSGASPGGGEGVRGLALRRRNQLGGGADEGGLFINERGCANIVPDIASKVYGGIYVMTDDDIASLDRSEGVATGCYEKKTVAATATGNGEEFDCLVSIDPRIEPGAPREGYLERILQGAQDCGLPGSYQSEKIVDSIGGIARFLRTTAPCHPRNLPEPGPSAGREARG